MPTSTYTSWSDRPTCPDLQYPVRLSCPECRGLDILSWLSCRGCPSTAVLSRLCYTSCPDLSCSSRPEVSLQLWLSCGGCLVPIVLSWLSSPTGLTCCLVSTIQSLLSYPDCPVYISVCPGCPDSDVLSLLSCLLYQVLVVLSFLLGLGWPAGQPVRETCPHYPSLAVLSLKSFHSCPLQLVLSRLCPAPVVITPSRLSSPGFSCPYNPGLAVFFDVMFWPSSPICRAVLPHWSLPCPTIPVFRWLSLHLIHLLTAMIRPQYLLIPLRSLPQLPHCLPCLSVSLPPLTATLPEVLIPSAPQPQQSQYVTDKLGLQWPIASLPHCLTNLLPFYAATFWRIFTD
jgi:hypothetical protein